MKRVGNMKTKFIIIWANIKSKKLQSIALGVVFVAVSVLFFLSIQLFGTTGEYAELYNKSKSSQGLIYVNGEDVKDTVVDFLNSKSEISNVNVLNNYDEVVDANLEHGTDLIAIPDVFLTEISSSDYDQIKIVEGKSPSELTLNEVIFSYGKSQINDLEVGDKVIISTNNGVRELVIAGIGVDLTYNFDTITLNRFWTSQETINSLTPVEENYSVGITYSEYSKEIEQEIMDELDVLLGAEASKIFVLSFAIILEANSFFQVIMGAIFTLIGIILIVVGLFIIRSIIYNNIITESKKIATLKSTGFSSGNIVSTYAYEYGLIAIVSIIIGFFVSILLSDVVLADLHELRNMFGLSTKINIGLVIAAFIVILLIIEMTVCLVARRVSSINPAIALSRGMQVNETDSLVQITKYKRIPLSFVLAVKDIFYSKKMIITLVLFIIATSFTVITLSSVSYSLTSQRSNNQLWIGYDIDAKIINSDPMDLEDYNNMITTLENSQYIDGVITSYIDLKSQIYDRNQEKYITSISQAFILSDRESNEFSVLEGRIPANENEIILGSNLIDSLNLELGDYVTVRSLGEEKELLLVGRNQSMTNQGLTFNVFLDEMNPELLNNSVIQVKFKEGVTQEVINDEIDNLFGSNITVVDEEANATMLSMFDVLDLVVTGVIGIFAAISLVVLLNLNITNVNKERFNYGIYKSIGMNNSTIINIYLLKNSIINIVGLIIGGLIGIAMLPSITNAMTKTLGLVDYPTQIKYSSLLLALGIVFAVTFLNAIVIKNNISKITPKELLVE